MMLIAVLEAARHRRRATFSAQISPLQEPPRLIPFASHYLRAREGGKQNIKGKTEHSEVLRKEE